jgi:hypothetical protein
VNIGGKDYREFLLDINQLLNKKENDKYLSLDELQIAQHSTGDMFGYASIFGGSLIYDLDVGGDGDTRIILDAEDNSGSGSGDLAVYIPNSRFTADYVYLYSLFGEDEIYPNNDGFEEWGVQTTSTLLNTPTPSAILLSSMGISILSWMRRRKTL